MKRLYAKHEYSGKRVNSKKSRMAIKQHHGGIEYSHEELWRGEELKKRKTETYFSRSDGTTTPNITSSNHYETLSSTLPCGLRTYGRAPRVLRLEATLPPPPSRPNPTIESVTSINVNWPASDPEVENHNLVIEVANSSGENYVAKGNRIVDIQHVLKWAFSMSQHSLICIFSKIELVKELCNGYHSTFFFKCNMCDITWKQTSEPEENSSINKSFVWGTLTSGSYYTQATQILSVLDIPAMSDPTFRKIEKKLGKVWEEHLAEEMRVAGETEKAIAIKKGNVNADGIPFVTVYVDGGWSKRSYGHNYNAASGIACIIGKETKKCLYLGIRNKYCCMCQSYEKRNVTPKEHDCCRNYSGPSTAMETDIIVEGFQRSEELHGLQYLVYIGDGDSSVFANLRKNVSYGDKIKKIECKNHVVKNYTKALYKILANTKLPLTGRKLLKPRLQKLSVVARKIIIMNHKSPQIMRKDLRSGVLHVFGEHKDCASYYCRWQNAKEKAEIIKEDSNILPVIKKEAEVWSQICAANEAIIMKADRLSTETTNIAENLMSLLAKFNCGKRICLTKNGSFQRRAQLAGLSQSCGNKWQERAWKKATLRSPGVNFKKHLQRKEATKIRQTKYDRQRLFKPTAANADKDYGPKATNPPPQMNEAELKEECEAKLKMFQLNLEEINSIELNTRDQFDNDLYKTLHSDRLTASLFGMICKRKPITPCHNHVKSILYGGDFETKYTIEGHKQEPIIREKFEKSLGKIVRKAGLFIDQQYGFLAASPDGVVEGESSLVEIKCFPSLKRWAEKQKISSNIMELAIKDKKDFPLKRDKIGTVYLNKNHNHYYQVQGQLRITQYQKCYYVAQSIASEDIVVVEVEADEAFIKVMEQKLVAFYRSCVLPELVLRRHTSGYLCLDSPEITSAILNKKENKKNNIN